MSHQHVKVGPKRIIYCLLGIAIMAYCGYVVEILVMHIWHKAPHGEHTEAGLSKEDKLYQDMIAGVSQDGGHGAPVVDINSSHKLYDFHETKRTAIEDTQNLCVSCHGDVPHDKKKEVRAFLNMHAYFMACETCHIKVENTMTTKFVWYEKTTGKQKDKIDLSTYLKDTPYKLMPLAADGGKLYDNDQMVKYVDEFKSQVNNMAPSAKSAAMKVIHRPMTELKNAVNCENCHTPDRAKAYLPFEKIGYPERRANQLVGNEVVGMVNKYKEFYIPNFLKPAEGTESEN
jgi:mono/diheme cytochrome c family protein